MIKKPILATFLSLMLVSVFAFASIGNVYASTLPHKGVQTTGTSPSTMHPNSSGGGCGTWLPSNLRGAAVHACINYTWPTVNGDGYYNYHPVKAVNRCVVIVWLWILNTAGEAMPDPVDCKIGNDIHVCCDTWDDYFGGGRYQTSMEVYIVYKDGSIDQQTTWSPVMYT